MSDLPNVDLIALRNVPKYEKPNVTELDTSFNVYQSYKDELQYYASVHRLMLPTLLEVVKEKKPDLIVADRYAFAGVDVGIAMSIPCVVNSASILMDIDNPPNIIPAPFSNISVHVSLGFLSTNMLNLYVDVKSDWSVLECVLPFAIPLHVATDISATRSKSTIDWAQSWYEQSKSFDAGQFCIWSRRTQGDVASIPDGQPSELCTYTIENGLMHSTQSATTCSAIFLDDISNEYQTPSSH